MVLKVGDVVDQRYELRSDLGRGAAGIVFEARHRFTDRSVALKAVAPGVPRKVHEQLCARLMREARALAAVRHPGIVDVLDGGLTDDGTPFVVMEKLEGRTLEGLLATRSHFSPEDTVAIGLQLCDALDALHQVGIVHRDLKPDNVFLVRDRNGYERIKLVDFGIAQVVGSQGEKLTGIGALIGTPAYMSPEQLLALDVDQRADIYALGVTLFECLSGRVPYEGNYQRVVLQVCAPEGETPSVAEACPGAAPELCAAVERAMARKPEERFPSAIDFGRALYASLPNPRMSTCVLGPPPVPKFGPNLVARPAVQQRRRVPRVAYTTPVRVDLPDRSIDGRCEDISEGGLLVICRQSCDADVRAVVRFALPIEGNVVSCAAHVRWVRAARVDDPDGPRAIGLEFVDAAPHIKASIAQYLVLMGDGTRHRET